MDEEKADAIKRIIPYLHNNQKLKDFYLEIVEKALTVNEVWNFGVPSAPHFWNLSLNFPPNLSLDQTKFVLESYWFLLHNSWTWQSIQEFANNSFTVMNENIEKIMLKNDKNVDMKWYETMTSPDLPLIPDDMLLMRCISSTKNFDVIHMDFFDSYRTSSTTLYKHGMCLGKPLDEIDGQIEQYITCNKMRGLYISFGNMNGRAEKEVVLPPGIRFVWNKNASDRLKPEIKLNFKDGQTVELNHNYMNIYHRSYDVEFIPKPIADKFPNEEISQRIKNMKLGIEKLQNIFDQHKKNRKEHLVQSFLFKSQQRARERIKQKAHNKKEEELLIEKDAEKARKLLPSAMQEALEAETKNVSRKNKLFINAENLYQRVQNSDHQSSKLILFDKLLGTFALSRTAKKYAVGLTKRCAIIRQSVKSEKWRYLGKIDSVIKNKLQIKADKKCLK